MKIVTGYTGSPHITSNDQQGLNQGIFGTESYVLNVGQKFNATLNTATTITIEDGEGMMQGVHFRIDPGDTETIIINPGTPGFNRIDLICARYTKDSTTGIEAVNLVAVEGTPSESTATEPIYNTGDIRMGDTIVDYPLWKVSLSGVSPELTRVEKISGDKLLWTNPNPTDVSMSTMTVNLDLSDYDYVEVFYTYHTPSVQTEPTYITELERMGVSERDVIARHIVGKTGVACYSEVKLFQLNGNFFGVEKTDSRVVTVTNSSISWGKLYVSFVHMPNVSDSIACELNQYALIPYKIYGKHFA